MEFELWLAKVDAAVSAELGLSIDDLPDAPYRDLFDEGLTPEQAAQEVVEDAWERLDNYDYPNEIMDGE